MRNGPLRGLSLSPISRRSPSLSSRWDLGSPAAAAARDRQAPHGQASRTRHRRHPAGSCPGHACPSCAHLSMGGHRQVPTGCRRCSVCEACPWRSGCDLQVALPGPRNGSVPDRDRHPTFRVSAGASNFGRDGSPRLLHNVLILGGHRRILCTRLAVSKVSLGTRRGRRGRCVEGGVVGHYCLQFSVGWGTSQFFSPRVATDEGTQRRRRRKRRR